jgi:hypothetical protein
MNQFVKVISKYSAVVLLTLLLITVTGCTSTKSTFEPQKESTTSAYVERYRLYRIERGKQLVSLGGCDKCHTPKIKTLFGTESDPERFLSGYPQGEPLPELPDSEPGTGEWENTFYTTDGTVWVGRWGVSFAANITPDPETGLGAWTEEQFIETFRGTDHIGGGSTIRSSMPMQAYSQLSNEELRSIYLYLQVIKPIKNKVPDPVRPDNL